MEIRRRSRGRRHAYNVDEEKIPERGGRIKTEGRQQHFI